MSAQDTHTFLLEIGCEEIPDRMLEAARRDLAAALREAMASQRLLSAEEEAQVASFATPRRLAVRVAGVRSSQPEETRVVTGPPVSAAFDGEGRPTRAAEGFAASQDVAVTDLFRQAGAKGEVVAVRRTRRGHPAAEVLAGLVPGLVLGLTFPKSMTWGEGGIEFVRPIRWLVALLDDAVVPLTIAGVTADRLTMSRRGSGAGVLSLAGAMDYEEMLLGGEVVADPDARREMMKGIHAAAARAGGEIVADDSLGETVLNMVEYPGCLEGSFPDEFLDLPAEVLTTTLRHHQHCFTVAGKDGRLLARFVAVVNAPRDPDGAIRAGYERVIAGRLADARFFYREDRRQPLASRLEMLARTRFHADLGSYADKVRRMQILVGRLAGLAGLAGEVGERAMQAAALSKCDLATQMENEFPELQGVVGGLYAREEGEAAEIWRAVYDHYSPEGLDDNLPRDREGILVSLADRLDNLVGLMGVGVVPRGSRDPFALRRAALGVVRLLAEGPLHLPVAGALAAAREAYGDAPVPWKSGENELLGQVHRFLEGRVRHLFEQGREKHRYDSVAAVLAAGWDDLADAAARLRALSSLRGQSDFEALAAASKRIRNILSKAEENGVEIPAEVNPELLEDEAEKELHAAAARVGAQAAADAASGNHAAVLAAVAALRPEVDKFFDTVLVMAEQEELRRNRLALLAQVAGLYRREADFAEIVVEGAS
ncbi:MAG: glycine--tRNA ligase subunit beta [Acidobacteria bacterium]|nr:glycine--tRNA ligase subunit beta [Acidobacteriota bacterium]